MAAESERALPRVACVVTVYYPRSHADVLVSKLLADYTHPFPRDPARFDYHDAARDLTELPLPTDAAGRLRSPRVQVVSMYLEQLPENDIGRAWATRGNVPLYDSVRGALTLGGDSLAVDAVLLIGEHGDYPYNERQQKEYPRRRLFGDIVEVMRESGRAVPIFNDKHLGYAWEDARWMYDQARELGAPLLAGSSVPIAPIAWRLPAWELPLDTKIDDALVVGYSHIEQYGFHTLEALQCVVERRAGGETGVASVRAITGEAVWHAQSWNDELLEAAIAAEEEGRRWRRPAGALSEQVPEPALFEIDYRDGLRASVLTLDGIALNWDVAVRVGGAVQATCFRLQRQEPFGHFAWQLEAIQEMIDTGAAPQRHPPERCLLTTGILDRAMESLWRGGVRLDTPELAINYRLKG